MDISKVLSQRTDLSKFLVHLTRDIPGQSSAKENLISILKDKHLFAKNFECLFTNKLNNQNDNIKNQFKTTSFTETPLDKLHLLTSIAKRKKEFQPYGLIFNKSLIKTSGGNPVFYLHSENREITKYLWEKYDEFIADPKSHKNFPKFGSRVNFIKDNVIDFYWEREWKVCGDLEFRYDDLVAIICPEHEQLKLRSHLIGLAFNESLNPDYSKEPYHDENGEYYPPKNLTEYFLMKLVLIDINWSLEEMVLNLSSQINDPWNYTRNPDNPYEMATEPFI